MATAKKRTAVIRKPELVEAAKEVLANRDASKRYDSAMRKIRKAVRPLAEDGHSKVRIGPALISLEWKPGQKTTIPDDVKERYTHFDEHAKLGLSVDDVPTKT